MWFINYDNRRVYICKSYIHIIKKIGTNCSTTHIKDYRSSAYNYRSATFIITVLYTVVLLCLTCTSPNLKSVLS